MKKNTTVLLILGLVVIAVVLVLGLSGGERDPVAAASCPSGTVRGDCTRGTNGYNCNDGAYWDNDGDGTYENQDGNEIVECERVTNGFWCRWLGLGCTETVVVDPDDDCNPEEDVDCIPDESDCLANPDLPGCTDTGGDGSEGGGDATDF